jgi:hypothetical protein
MKICPVCNESFADQLNFCDIDGVRLAREGSAHERNKWWSLLGAGLLVGALIIIAMSIIFLPKARVSSPIVNSEPPPQQAPARQAPVESPATVAAAPALSTEPGAPSDAITPEVKKREKPLTNENNNAPAPNPKAVFSDEAEKKQAPIETALQPSTKSEAPAPVTAEATPKPQPPADLKKDSKDQPANAKASDDKKKTEEKDKKKGGFLRVFKKIFGKD